MKTNDYLIKVCGLTDPHNIVDLIKLEPDMIGLIFIRNHLGLLIFSHYLPGLSQRVTFFWGK